MPKLEVITRNATGVKQPTPLLFVHGAWHGAWCWDKHFLPYFAEKGYDAHALSLRNHGNSESPGSLKTVTLGDYVDDIESVVKTFDSPPVIIAHSMGGFVLQKYLERHRPAGAVLFASIPPTGTLPLSLNLLVNDTWNFLKANLTMSLYPLVSTPEQAKQMFFSNDMAEEEVAEYHAQLQDESYIAFLGTLLTLPTAMRIQVTPLVLGGGTDTVISPKAVRATAKAYRTEAVIFEDTAHDMMLERNWKQVADRILDWLSEI
ncbi:MAG: alpha/beta hydrolase [Candidatus Hydrogenedentes bacterium]|nr:alpha/beta hydrolase [Candidatus Hydrogenedentota bacterium]